MKPRLAAFALVLVIGSGCRRLAERAGGASTDAAPRTKEVAFEGVKLTVPDDTTVEQASGVLTLSRPRRPHEFKQDAVAMSPESLQQYQARVSPKDSRLALARGELTYHVDESIRASNDVVLFGEMKVEPDRYFYVTCNAYAVDGNRQPVGDWCLPILQTAARR